jgi:hypothetical protein
MMMILKPMIFMIVFSLGALARPAKRGRCLRPTTQNPPQTTTEPPGPTPLATPNTLVKWTFYRPEESGKCVWVFVLCFEVINELIGCSEVFCGGLYKNNDPVCQLLVFIYGSLS